MVESSATPDRRPKLLWSVALFVVVAAITAGAVTVRRQDVDGVDRARSGSVVAAKASITPSGGQLSSLPSGHSSSPTPTGIREGDAVSSLSGDALARAWLQAFLTRDDRNDDRWVASVASMSESEVVDKLRAAGPDAVGLQQLASWRVDRVDRVGDNDPALETSTRQVLPYAATVTDGARTVQKPFVLYAYLDPDGSWRIGDVEQPYSSEG